MPKHLLIYIFYEKINKKIERNINEINKDLKVFF